ncbi:MAG: malectin [Flavobacteriaceae bacterium]
MKTILAPKIYICLISFIFCFFQMACSDSNLEPIVVDPDTEDPMEDPADDDAMDDPEISDNPVLRINCGGEEVSYGDIVFTVDDFFTGDTEGFDNLEIPDILETEMDSIYVTERISSAALGNFEYKIPITNGTYKLRLHFAEIFWGAPGGDAGSSDSRVFDVDVEGEVVLNDFDIFAKVGAVTATVEEFVVMVEDQELNIKFTASTDRPKISAIEVLGDGQILTTGG